MKYFLLIACSRNPTLSFCDEEEKNETTTVTTDSGGESDGVANGSLPDLPTFQEELIRTVGNLTLIQKLKNINEEETEEILTSLTKNDSIEIPEDLNSEGIPDDPILDEPLPGASNSSEFGSLLRLPNPKKSKSRTPEAELVTPPPLPGILDIPPHLPENSKSSQKSSAGLPGILDIPSHVSRNSESSPKSSDALPRTLEIPPHLSRNSESSPKSSAGLPGTLEIPPHLPENSESSPKSPPIAPDVPEPSTANPEVVEVFITKFCVDNRKQFIVKCRRASVNSGDLGFCKSYASGCESKKSGVIPLLTYCERFLQNYVKICNPNFKRNKKEKEFCKAYDQFCVPPPTPADLLIANQNLVSCEDIVPEARKVCNPFPQPSDRLNHIRCTQFFKFCRKFVDWL